MSGSGKGFGLGASRDLYGKPKDVCSPGLLCDEPKEGALQCRIIAMVSTVLRTTTAMEFHRRYSNDFPCRFSSFGFH